MMETKPKRSINLPGRITIYPSQDRAIDQILRSLMERCPAQYALIAEVSGQLVFVHGDRDLADPVVLASLIAGDMAASKEIARVTGQYQNFQFVLREGHITNTFITEAGEHLILYVQVAKDVPLGWARIVINEAGHKLEEVMLSDPEDMQDTKIELKQDGLGKWVDDALNSLWNK